MNSKRPSSESPTKELLRPRPSPLKICRESHKVRKPAPAVPAVHSTPITNRSQPTIIYMQPPKIIHAEVRDFMALVQRLTGSSSSSPDTRNAHHSENLTADHDSAIHQGFAATATHWPAASVENMGMSTSCDFVNHSSWWTTKIDKNQETGSRASEPEANEHGLSAATSVSTATMFSPLSPNFLFSSPCLNLSPSVFNDLPLMTLNSDNSFSSSTDFYRFSEPLFSPPHGIPSPSPTALDLYKINPEY